MKYENFEAINIIYFTVRKMPPKPSFDSTRPSMYYKLSTWVQQASNFIPLPLMRVLRYDFTVQCSVVVCENGILLPKLF